MESSSSSNYHYNKRLSSSAREFRRNMTKAEACLWKYVLSAGSMKGFTFRRQRPVLQHIADFMCKELELIIEVDGITHSYEDVAENDKIRQKALENAGFKIIRYSDEEVLKHINSVRDAIEAEVIQLMKEKDVTPRIRNRKRS